MLFRINRTHAIQYQVNSLLFSSEALLVSTKVAGIGMFGYVRSYTDYAADGLDRDHQRRFGQVDSARVTFGKERK